MKTNGNEWSGLTAENHLSWVNPFLAYNDYSNNDTRIKLIEFLGLSEQESKTFSTGYLIEFFLKNSELSEEKKSKINSLLMTVSNNEYLLLLGLINNLLKNDKSNKRR